MMCLGITKNVTKIVKKEMYLILPLAIIGGLMLAYPLSIGVWTMFKKFIISTSETEFNIGYMGYGIGFVYSIGITLLINTMLSTYLKKLDIMKILKAEETIEEIKEVKPYMTLVGIALILGGILLMDLFFKSGGRLSFLGTPCLAISAFGIYLICARLPYYGDSKKKRNPKKYYENIVFYSLLKLKGKQYVNAIFTTTLIIGVSTFSLIFILSQILSTDQLVGQGIADYSLKYRSDVENVTEEEIKVLADKCNVTIEDFYSYESLLLMESGYDYDEKTCEEFYVEQLSDASIISESTYELLTEEILDVKPDYFVYASPQATHFMAKEETLLTNHMTSESKTYKNQEVRIVPLTDGILKYVGRYYVLDNQEYEKAASTLSADAKVNNIIFLTDNWEEEYGFGDELRDMIISRTDKKINEHAYCEIITATYKSETCPYDPIELSEDNPEVARWWKYTPNFKILSKNDAVYEDAVYLLLFIFISTLGFIAASIILYVKSLSSIWNDKQIYQNISYLGAKQAYIKKCISKLQRILFVIPTVIGTLSALIMLTIIAASGGTEYMLMLVKTGAPLLIVVYFIQMICYLISKKKIIEEVLKVEL